MVKDQSGRHLRRGPSLRQTLRHHRRQPDVGHQLADFRAPTPHTAGPLGDVRPIPTRPPLALTSFPPPTAQIRWRRTHSPAGSPRTTTDRTIAQGDLCKTTTTRRSRCQTPESKPHPTESPRLRISRQTAGYHAPNVRATNGVSRSCARCQSEPRNRAPNDGRRSGRSRRRCQLNRQRDDGRVLRRGWHPPSLVVRVLASVPSPGPV